MSANPRDALRDPARLGEALTRPLPGSAKLYVCGSRPDLRVAMREITQSPTPGVAGPVPNPAVVVYDTSGPYTDPAAAIDIRSGLAPLRQKWIEERNDTEALDGTVE